MFLFPRFLQKGLADFLYPPNKKKLSSHIVDIADFLWGIGGRYIKAYLHSIFFANIPIFRFEKDSAKKKWGQRQCWGAHFGDTTLQGAKRNLQNIAVKNQNVKKVRIWQLTFLFFLLIFLKSAWLGCPQKNTTGFLLNILATKYRISNCSFFSPENLYPYANFDYFCVILGGREICKTKWNS